MWTTAVILVVVLCLLAYAAIRVKVAVRTRNGFNNLTSPRMTPFARALAELVAVAGGVYLALLGLVNFLHIALPEKVFMLGVGMEPLAIVSLTIALLQPYVGVLFQRVRQS